MGAGPHAPVLWQRCQQGSEGHGWEQLRDRGQHCAMCVWFKTAGRAQQTEKRRGGTHISSWNSQGEVRVRTWRWTPQCTWGEMWGPPASLCSSLPSQPSSTPHCHSLAPAGPLSAAVIYRLGEVSVRWCIWTGPAHFPLERGSSSFVFQSGLGQALPSASWPAGRILALSLTATPSQLCFSLLYFFLLFFFFPLSLPSPLSPSIMEKQFRFSRFTEQGKGWGNTCSFSNKCFSSSPWRGNSSEGWWGFQPASPSPWPRGSTFASIPSTGKGKKKWLRATQPKSVFPVLMCEPATAKDGVYWLLFKSKQVFYCPGSSEGS